MLLFTIHTEFQLMQITANARRTHRLRRWSPNCKNKKTRAEIVTGGGRSGCIKSDDIFHLPV